MIFEAGPVLRSGGTS